MNHLSIQLSQKERIVGSCYLFFQLLALPFILAAVANRLPFTLTDIELNFVLFSINFLATVIIFRKLLIGCGKISLATPKRTLLAAAAGFGLYWLGSILMSYLAVSVDPSFQNVNDASISLMAEENFPLMFIATVLLAPVTEELLYRGLVFGSLYRRSRTLAYCVSALFFASLHVIGYIGSYSAARLLLCLIQYLPAGYAIAYAYEKADSIWAPILLHTANNLLAMIII